MTNIIILASVALFLFWRLFSVLGNRQGHEENINNKPTKLKSVDLNVDINSNVDNADEDIADYVDIDSSSGNSLKEMKKSDKNFNVKDFISGAKKAYELIIVSFERGDVEKLRPLLLDEVFEAFSKVIDERANNGYTVEIEFGGVREIRLKDASYDKENRIAEITLSFVSDISSVVKDVGGKVVEGDPKKIKKQKDTWTFFKNFSKKEPNWFLVSTNG